MDHLILEWKGALRPTMVLVCVCVVVCVCVCVLCVCVLALTKTTVKSIIIKNIKTQTHSHAERHMNRHALPNT